MSDDKNGGGSDLDIFEGLGKKSSASTVAAVPPPPPGSGAHVSGAVAPKPTELKKTLLGMAHPAQPPSAQNLPAVQPSSQTNMPAVRPSSAPLRGAPPPSADGMAAPPASGSMRAAQPLSQPPAPSASKPPPPPPGRGSLPNLAAQPTSQPPMAAAPKSAPPPVPAAPSTRPTAVAQAAASSQPNGKQLDMDWDDDDEATHVFDKESRDNQQAAEAVQHGEREPDRADMDAILSSPPRTSSVPMPAAGTPPPPAPATLSGAFANLGQTNGAPSASFRSGPPASQSIRSAPPPPPVSVRSPSQSPISAVPPPPPPGSPTTQPMHMPPRPPSAPPPSGAHPAHAQQVPGGGGMHQPMSNFPSAPPMGSMSQPPVSAVPQMPPVSRMMEPTAIVPRPQPSRAGLWVGLLVAVMAIVGIAVFLLMPRTGTLVVNVADTKGATVPNLQVLVDGTKKCDSAPCILKDIPAGVHEVKVVAPGFDSLAPRAITIEARRDASTDFTLSGGKSVGGTGFKVAGNQPGVKVSVDGKDLGTLPAEAHDLEPGDHKLHFAGSERYAPLDKSITVGKDEIVDIGSVQLKVLKGKAMITLGTPGAKVFLVSGATRKEVPQFPIAIDFDPNEHWQLEAKKDGFDDFVKPISFDDGIAEKTIDVTLSPKGSRAPQPQAQLAAPPAFAPARQQPVAKADPPAQKDTSADPAPAKPAAPAGTGAGGGDSFLNINSLPASTVVLDGKPLGPTPRVHVQVSPGSHTIMFVNAEQSLKKSISVTVGAGETKAAFAKLRD
ncbi:MAG TPA: carboxypeptidase regulatory-like domain-containing protein [Labilithrix sp.]